MQAIRSLISRFVPLANLSPAPVSVQQPTRLNEQDLGKVAGGLPVIGGLSATTPPDALPTAA